jgi:hypothetical protein
MMKPSGYRGNTKVRPSQCRDALWTFLLAGFHYYQKKDRD